MNTGIPAKLLPTARLILAALVGILLSVVAVAGLLWSNGQVAVVGGAQSAPVVNAATLTTNQAITTTATAISAPFNVSNHDTISLWVDYNQGDEYGIILTVYWSYSNAAGALEFQEADWSAAAGERILVTNSYSLTATSNAFLTFDVTGVPYARVYVQGTGTITTAGAITVTYSATQP